MTGRVGCQGCLACPESVVVAYRAEWVTGGLVRKFWGEVTDQELHLGNLEVYDHACFDDTRYAICDFLDVDAIDLSEGELKKIAYMDIAAAKSNPRVKVAGAAELDVIKDYTAIYANYNEPSPWKTRFFRTMAEAHAWIDAETAG